jgi:hypothetical protein
MQKDDGLTAGGPDVHVPDVQRTGVDPLHRPERRRVHSADLCDGRLDHVSDGLRLGDHDDM